MNLTVGEFKFDHFNRVQCRDAPTDVLSGFSLESDMPAMSRTLYLDGAPVAMIGLIPRHPGVARVWTWFSDEAGSHMLSLTKIARELIAYSFGLGFKRLDAEIDCANDQNIRWAEMLGFEREATMKNYGLHGNGDYYLYRMLSDG